MSQELILYVHVPFCSSKCHFCSWVSPIAVSELVKNKHRFQEYTSAVIQEIRATGQRLHARAIRPKLIYFGGGTPSLLPSADLVAILRELHEQFPGAAATMDATLEISPDTLTSERASILRQGGFNRVSFGVQSFIDERARALGRAHTPLQAIEGFQNARRGGFENINVDLMIGLPGETDDEFRKNLETALQLEPDHMSIYLYKKIEGTVLAKQINSGKVQECAPSVAADRYEQARRTLISAGFDEYMFQLFTRNGKRCLVDYHYFNLDADYLGFGQGAHTLVNGRHYFHSQSLEQYLQHPAHNRSVPVAEEDQALITKLYEMMHFDSGVDFARFEQRLGISVDDAARKHPLFHRALSSAMETGAVERAPAGLRFTSREARVKWLTKPSYWTPEYKADPEPQLLQILPTLQPVREFSEVG